MTTAFPNPANLWKRFCEWRFEARMFLVGMILVSFVDFVHKDVALAIVALSLCAFAALSWFLRETIPSTLRFFYWFFWEATWEARTMLFNFPVILMAIILPLAINDFVPDTSLWGLFKSVIYIMVFFVVGESLLWGSAYLMSRATRRVKRIFARS